MTSAEIDKAVLRFRKECGLESVNYKSLFNAAEKLGYTVIEFGGTVSDINVKNLIEALDLEAETKLTKGFTYAQGDYRLIFIDAALSEKEKTIVISHELGHVVLGHIGHRNFTGQDVQDEYEANEFSNFLLKSDNKLVVLFTCYKKGVITAVAAVSVLAAVLVLLVVPRFKTADSGKSLPNGENELTGSDLTGLTAETGVSGFYTEDVTEPSTEGETQPATGTVAVSAAVPQTVYVPMPVPGTTVPAAVSPKPAQPDAKPKPTQPAATEQQTTKPQTTKPQTTRPPTTRPPTTRPHTPEDDFGGTALYEEIKAEMSVKYADVSPTVSYDSDAHKMKVVGTLPDGMYHKLFFHDSESNAWWYPIAEGAIADAAEKHNRIAAEGLNVTFVIEIHSDEDFGTTILRSTNGKIDCYMNYYDFYEAPGILPGNRNTTAPAENTENQ